MKQPFNIEEQFKLYLQLVKLHPENMQPNQLIELKRVFYGAVGQLSVHLQAEVLKSINPGDEFDHQTDHINAQVIRFMVKEINT